VIVTFELLLELLNRCLFRLNRVRTTHDKNVADETAGICLSGDIKKRHNLDCQMKQDLDHRSQTKLPSMRGTE